MSQEKMDKGDDSNQADVSKDEIKSGIDQIINQERVVIFSKNTCPYCDDAKKVIHPQDS